MTDLQRFDNNGLELIINTKTGESFASISGYARMSGLTQQAISLRINKLNPTSDNYILIAEMLTATGVKTHKLLTEDLISEWIVKDNPELATKLIQAGVRVYLHTLAGYKVSSTATKKELTPLEILEQQVRLMRAQQDELDKLKLQVQEFNEFKEEVIETRKEAIAHLKFLPEPSVQVAELKPKEQLNRMVRDYAIVNNVAFGFVYNWIYREFRDRYHIDLKVRGTNNKPKLSGTEYADKYSMIDKLYAVASEVLV
jgi:hypothetical protein